MRENAGKIRTRITPNTDTFYVVLGIILNLEFHILAKRMFTGTSVLRILPGIYDGAFFAKFEHI